MPAAEALPRRLLRPRPRQTCEGDTPHYRQRTRQGQRDPLPTLHSLARQENANNPTLPPETSCQSLAPQLGHFSVPPGMLLPQFGQYFLSTGAAVNVGCDPIEYEDLVDSPDLSSCEIAPSTVTYSRDDRPDNAPEKYDDAPTERKPPSDHEACPNSRPYLRQRTTVTLRQFSETNYFPTPNLRYLGASFRSYSMMHLLFWIRGSIGHGEDRRQALSTGLHLLAEISDSGG